MGSKKYPYKGIIDHLANRGFSNGTNAWTADDHTCYTLSTAGGQGFLQMLPVYVDHILLLKKLTSLSFAGLPVTRFILGLYLFHESEKSGLKVR